ncbi:acyltransferase [Aliarcobacter butzleri]|uniref:acyltransferase family protein n=2 Tax=Aliarcobacter butzleri TaxID=28197 RepID=UPI00263D2711|nr:acyltransferase [Aliarcobacter butzleri]MDN5045622.1 acyltransferase [Aliarcobacter butzleri]
MVNKNNHLNFFRLLFALQVVYMHSTAWLKLPRGGDMTFDIIGLFPGVPLFFITSGFLITESFLNSSSIQNYAKKRFLRIYPALFINILILELAMYIGNNMNDFNISIFKYLSYLIVYILTASSGISTTVFGFSGVDIYNFNGFFQSYPSGVLWTLTVELSFYFALPVILLFYKKSRLLTSFIIFILFFSSIYLSSIASQKFYSSSSFHQLLEVTFLPYAWIFLIGVILRLYWKNISKYLVDKGIYFLLIYLLFSFISNKYFGSGLWVSYKYSLNFITVIEVILLGIAMISLAFSFTKIKIGFKSDLSYATYLYHMLIVHIILSSGMKTGWYTYFIVIFVTLIIAYISWRFVESPILKLKKKRILFEK